MLACECAAFAQMEYYTQRIADTEDWSMVRLYADEGITGTSTKKRAQFNRMIRDTENGCKTARGNTAWSDHTVRHILRNEKYMGTAAYFSAYRNIWQTVSTSDIKCRLCDSLAALSWTDPMRQTPVYVCYGII